MFIYREICVTFLYSIIQHVNRWFLSLNIYICICAITTLLNTHLYMEGVITHGMDSTINRLAEITFGAK